MASLDPDLAAALDKMMRSDLDAWSSLWFWVLVGSTIAVAIGIVAEAPEVWKELGLGRETVAHIRKWWCIRVRRLDLNGWENVCPELIANNDSRRRWIVKAAFIGWLLVAIGVVGEGIAEYFVNDAETGIRAFDEARLAETTEQAGNAATSAKTAHGEADTVDKEAKDLKVRLDAASRELGQLENNVAAQGPRAKLLNKAAPRLVKELSPFARQRVELFVCGQQGLAEQETLDTWGAIANILDSDTVAGVAGAKWKEVPTNLNWAANCGASRGLGQGVGVLVSKGAPKRVLEAATVLGHGLAKVLPPSPNKSPGLIDPDFARMTVNRGFMPKDAPWTIVAFDQDLIVVVIGEHP